MLSTFLLTVVFDITVAVEIGLVLASLFFILRISSLTRLEPLDIPGFAPRADGRRVGVWRLFGSLFFGSVTKLEQLLDPANPLPDVVVLEMDKVINMDTTGLDALESLLRMLRSRGGRLVIAELNAQPVSLMRRSGFYDELGAPNVFDSLEEALEAAHSDPMP
jgi:SulP family sulfate permease